MATIDLSTPITTPLGLLDGLARRVTLTLPELRFIAAEAGGAPLPCEPPDRVEGSGGAAALDQRLGESRSSLEDAAYAAALTALPDPADSLIRRGLVVQGQVEPGLLGAVGLLATPRLALDIDVAAGPGQAKAWHRQGGEAVASLATADGLVFELAWFPAPLWADEIARAAVLPEDVTLADSAVPDRVVLPLGLADAATEGLRAGRADLLPVLVEQHGQAVSGPDGAPLTPTEVVELLMALTRETRGRIRVLATYAGSAGRGPVGVVAWLLVADGWRAIRPLAGDEEDLVELVRVSPEDLATELAPVLAEVTG